MRAHDESHSLLDDYFGFDRKTLLVFLGLVASVMFVVTCIYVAIFGFDNWKTNMARAGSMMIANFDAPVTGTTEQFIGPGAPRSAPGAVPAAAQYICPNCGAVGLPGWSTNGTPICPNCGVGMTLAGMAGGNVRVAAAP